jgi:hypothetical protein
VRIADKQDAGCWGRMGKLIEGYHPLLSTGHGRTRRGDYYDTHA